MKLIGKCFFLGDSLVGELPWIWVNAFVLSLAVSLRLGLPNIWVNTVIGLLF